MRILVLCTANQCRSPMAEVLLAEHLRRRQVSAVVESAGFRTGGRPAAAHARKVMAQRGLTLAAHVSRTVSPALLADADLVLTMERSHVRSAVLLRNDCWPVCFSLGELLVRAREGGARAQGQPLEEWIASLHAGRRPSDLVGGPAAGDVADPISGPLRKFRQTAEHLDAALGELVDLAVPGGAWTSRAPRPVIRRGLLSGPRVTLRRR